MQAQREVLTERTADSPELCRATRRLPGTPPLHHRLAAPGMLALVVVRVAACLVQVHPRAHHHAPRRSVDRHAEDPLTGSALLVLGIWMLFVANHDVLRRAVGAVRSAGCEYAGTSSRLATTPSSMVGGSRADGAHGQVAPVADLPLVMAFDENGAGGAARRSWRTRRRRRYAVRSFGEPLQRVGAPHLLRVQNGK